MADEIGGGPDHCGGEDCRTADADLRNGSSGSRRSAARGSGSPACGGSDGYNSLSGTVSFIHYTGASYLIGVVIEKLDKHFTARMQYATKETGLRVGGQAIVR